MARKRLRSEDVLAAIQQMNSDSDDSDLESNSGASVASDDDVGSSDRLDNTDVDDVDCTQTDDDSDEWRKLSTTANNFTQLPFSLTNTGFQLSGTDVPEDETGFFQLFFSDTLFQELAENTNEYAHVNLSKMQLRARSIWHKWADVTADEMKAYIAVILNMAMNEKPGVFDYFSKQWVTHMPFFSDIFSRDRFLQIRWMLHVTSSANGNTDKISNMVKHIKSKCMEYFVAGRDIAIDETTVAFKGRAGFKMYNPQKPTKWGLRIYTLGDSATGYIVTFEPYYGQKTTESLTRPDLPFTSRIVIHLVNQLLQETNATGYHLFTDRYYTSYVLAVELLKMNVHLTGTVQRTRQGLPPELKQKVKLKKHEVIAYETKTVMMLVWLDKRPVLYICFQLSTMPVHSRYKDV